MKSLIIYFSRAGENYLAGSLKNLEKGNTEVVAEMIQDITGADIFKVEPEISYPYSYNECIELASADQKRDARPEIKGYPQNIEQYDIVYLGYPNYWSTMPMFMFTLLEKLDMKDKVIKPFCTHEGSGMGRSESDIRMLCPDARVEKGLAVQGCRVAQSKAAVEKWLAE